VSVLLINFCLLLIKFEILEQKC